ncbi:ABC transporter permease subunit [Paenibacillus lentus]|uniref:ABC transporter permease subunit n=1 Tax=Paenibacillus lentus TaxID=1338368 RepID=UPI0036559F61
MKGIVIKEFIGLIRGIKSILIVLFITGVSILAARSLRNSPLFMDESSNPSATALAGLSFILVIFGALFVLTLSHDIVNRDIQLQRIRLLITKTSRTSVILGKFLAVWLFWVIVSLISFVLVSFITRTFVIHELLFLWIYLAFLASICVMLSTVVINHAYSVILSVLLGLALPIFGTWSLFSSVVPIRALRYVLPYYPMSEQPVLLLVTVVEVLVFLAAAMVLFQRKDL